jgi:hypothetical protein
MTPKEKAIDLVEKYHIKVKVTFTEHSIPSIVNAQMLFSSAKKCALIAVDEIVHNIDGLDDSVWYSNTYSYWQEVKQEIEKL